VSLQDPLLSANLSVDYRHKTGVLRNIFLCIKRQEILGLVGQSGSGKSTLALSLMGLLSPKGGAVKGEILFRGKDLLKSSEKELRAIRGKEMSIVLQSPLAALNPSLSIGSQLTEAWKAHERGNDAQGSAATQAALTSVSLPNDKDFLRRRPSQLSVGQGQRVCIAMAILHRPALLLADEATSALDPITQSEILNLFARLNCEMGTAILYISHDLVSVAALCHRICILHEGQIVECGTPEAIFNSPQHEYTRRLVAALPQAPTRTIPDRTDSQDAARLLVQHSSF
jgi:ABC-type dipeptide/oligopeptide/nickel transport system ATPase component